MVIVGKGKTDTFFEQADEIAPKGSEAIPAAKYRMFSDGETGLYYLISKSQRKYRVYAFKSYGQMYDSVLAKEKSKNPKGSYKYSLGSLEISANAQIDEAIKPLTKRALDKIQISGITAEMDEEIRRMDEKRRTDEEIAETEKKLKGKEPEKQPEEQPLEEEEEIEEDQSEEIEEEEIDEDVGMPLSDDENVRNLPLVTAEEYDRDKRRMLNASQVFGNKIIQLYGEMDEKFNTLYDLVKYSRDGIVKVEPEDVGEHMALVVKKLSLANGKLTKHEIGKIVDEEDEITQMIEEYNNEEDDDRRETIMKNIDEKVKTLAKKVNNAFVQKKKVSVQGNKTLLKQLRKIRVKA